MYSGKPYLKIKRNVIFEINLKIKKKSLSSLVAHYCMLSRSYLYRVCVGLENRGICKSFPSMESHQIWVIESKGTGLYPGYF